MIKSDAIIDIKISAGFMQKLQQTLMFIVKDLNEEDLKLYKELAESKQGFTEEWMEALTVISVLLKELEVKADEQGFVYESNGEELTTPE
jgi:hypothetical protein